MNKDRMKGMIDEVAGSAKRKAGELTDNPKLQAEGMAQQVKGKVEGAWGKAKEAVHGVITGSEVRLDAHVKLGLKDSAATVGNKELVLIRSKTIRSWLPAHFRKNTEMDWARSSTLLGRIDKSQS